MAHTILLVDDEQNILNSLMRVFRKDGYNIVTANDGGTGLELAKIHRPSLVISDFRMPGMNGVELLAKIKDLSSDTRRFMLTGYADMQSVIAAINSGEVLRYFTKPWDDVELKAAVSEALFQYDTVQENKRLQEETLRQNAALEELNRTLEAKVAARTKKIRDDFFSFVKITSNIIELYDQATGSHSKRVASMARAIAKRMDFEANDVDLTVTAALLHCIGLIGLPREIIDKDPLSLTADEIELLKHNPQLSQEIIDSIDILKQAGLIIRGHMERYDGTGYPDGLRGNEIHPGSQIIFACKLLDKLRQKHVPMNEALSSLEAESGTGLDPEIVKVFLKAFDKQGAVAPAFAHDATAPIIDAPKCPETALEIHELVPGMVVSRNIMSKKGNVLITHGTVLSVELINKIIIYHKIDPVNDKIHVLLPEVMQDVE